MITARDGGNGSTDRTPPLSHAWRTVESRAGGLGLDLVLYAVSAGFAALTAARSTLPPHQAWGAIAVVGYLAAMLLVLGQLLARWRRRNSPLAGTGARAAVTAAAWAATGALPLLRQAFERGAGHPHRAQEEVVVVEDSGSRLVTDGTPYLGRDEITALPLADQLLGYTPYQPGMALFGLPRAMADAWWTDARLWFASVTLVALALAVATLRTATPVVGRRQPDATLLRAVQAATVLPVCTLTLATGGGDLPVLALCLLALALAATGRPARAGLAAGLAGALKLLAWPLILVLLCWAATQRVARRVAAGSLGLPAAALLPAVLVDRDALIENVLRFPLGTGLVSSPAQSPLPGHLITAALPAGRAVAGGLLVVAGLTIGVRLLRRPPRTAATTALICGYGLLTAIALMPSTRFGYLLYPLALLMWTPALRLAAEPAVALGRGAIRTG